MTKEEIIQEAYGEYWEQLGPLTKGKALCSNGWLHYDDITDNRGTLINCIHMERDIDHYRPKSLQGIEDNNGWTKIESEDDFPKLDEYCYCWLLTIDNDVILREWNPDAKGFFGPRVVEFTHYKPIVKPKPPAY